MYVENGQPMHMTYVLTKCHPTFLSACLQELSPRLTFTFYLPAINVYRLTKKEDVPKSGTPSHLFI